MIEFYWKELSNNEVNPKSFLYNFGGALQLCETVPFYEIRFLADPVSLVSYRK